MEGNKWSMMHSFNCKYAEVRSKLLPAFFQSTDIEEVTLSDNVEEICENALWSCRNIKTIVLPKYLKTIGSSAFGETSLKELAIPASVEKIEEGYVREIDNPIKIIVEGNKDSKMLELPSSKETTLYLNRNVVYNNEIWGFEGYIPDTLIFGANVSLFKILRSAKDGNGAKEIFCLNNDFANNGLSDLVTEKTIVHVLTASKNGKYHDMYSIDALEYEATGEIIDFAGKNNMPFSIVPKFYQNGQENFLKEVGEYELFLQINGSPFDGIYPTSLKVKVRVPDGISGQKTDKAEMIEYYDLNGLKVNANAHTVRIKKVIFSDGTSKTYKVK